MSDQQTKEAAEPIPVVQPVGPHAMIVESPQGGFIGIMHHGDTIRAFAGESMARLRALFSKVAISEFGLPQDQADSVADSAATRHADSQTASEHEDLAAHEELQGELDKANAALATAQKEAADAQASLSALQAKFAASDAECQRLQAENTRLSEQLQLNSSPQQTGDEASQSGAAGDDVQGTGSTSASSQEQTGDGSAGAAGTDAGPAREA